MLQRKKFTLKFWRINYWNVMIDDILFSFTWRIWYERMLYSIFPHIYDREVKKERTTHIAIHSAVHIHCFVESPPQCWQHISQEASKHLAVIKFSWTVHRWCLNSLWMVCASLKCNSNICKSQVLCKCDFTSLECAHFIPHQHQIYFRFNSNSKAV